LRAHEFCGGVRVAHLLSFLCCHIICLYVLCSDVRYDVRIQTMVCSTLSPVVCMGVYVLFTLFVFGLHSGVKQRLCSCFSYLRLVSCVPNVASYSVPSIFFYCPSVFSNVYLLHL
jgi:hypothetical protein